VYTQIVSEIISAKITDRKLDGDAYFSRKEVSRYISWA